MKKLIVGKNSRVINSLNINSIEYDLISHKEITSVEFSHYDEIFLFSWSHKSIKENEEIIKNLPNNKLVFVSSIAVFSLIACSQWNKYPNWKLKLENFVLNNGGKILRLGIIEGDENNHALQYLPITYFEKIKEYIELSPNKKKSITNLYELQHVNINISYFKKIIFLIYLKLCNIFPKYMIF